MVVGRGHLPLCLGRDGRCAERVGRLGRCGDGARASTPRVAAVGRRRLHGGRVGTGGSSLGRGPVGKARVLRRRCALVRLGGGHRGRRHRNCGRAARVPHRFGGGARDAAQPARAGPRSSSGGAGGGPGHGTWGPGGAEPGDRAGGQDRHRAGGAAGFRPGSRGESPGPHRGAGRADEAARGLGHRASCARPGGVARECHGCRPDDRRGRRPGGASGCGGSQGAAAPGSRRRCTRRALRPQPVAALGRRGSAGELHQAAAGALRGVRPPPAAGRAVVLEGGRHPPGHAARRGSRADRGRLLQCRDRPLLRRRLRRRPASTGGPGRGPGQRPDQQRDVPRHRPARAAVAGVQGAGPRARPQCRGVLGQRHLRGDRT